MKRILILIISLMLFSCNSNIKIKEKDILKYEWLKPFILKNKCIFDDGYHDLDLGTMYFSYSYTNIVQMDSVLFYFDEIAKIENWDLNSKLKDKRIYSKKIDLYPAFDDEIVLQIRIDVLSRKIEYNIE